MTQYYKEISTFLLLHFNAAKNCIQHETLRHILFCPSTAFITSVQNYFIFLKTRLNKLVFSNLLIDF